LNIISTFFFFSCSPYISLVFFFLTFSFFFESVFWNTSSKYHHLAIFSPFSLANICNSTNKHSKDTKRGFSQHQTAYYVYKRNELWSCMVLLLLFLSLCCLDEDADWVSRMRGDASRQQRGADDGRNSHIVTSNGQQQQSSSPPPPPNQPPNLDSSSSSLYPPTSTNGTSSSVLLPHGRTSSFSYSSILTSTPNTQIPSADSGGGNGVHGGNHDRPFKYSKDEMLSIWKNNASRLKSAGIPLEFEKHDAFTSEDPLDPALLTEMTTAEKDVTSPTY